MTLQDILNPLQEIDGYLASAVFDMNGHILINHSNSKYDIGIISNNILTLIKNGITTANTCQLGKFNFIQVDSESAIFSAIYSETDHLIITSLLEAKGNIGLAKLALIQAAKNITSA